MIEANFNPTILGYSPTGSFKFWCQKVLPLVYDNSLSYYELLCKVVNYLNEVIKNVDNMNESIQNLNTAFLQLQEYVNMYFDDLNVQAFVDHKLDEMVEDGTLARLIEPYIDQLAQTVNDSIERQDQRINDSISEQNRRISDSITYQNNTINNSINNQNQTIANALDEVNNVVDSFDDRINLLVDRMNNLVTSYGSTNMTQLFYSSSPQAIDDEITLSESADNFDFLDIYYTYGNVNVPEVGNSTTQVPNLYYKRIKPYSYNTYFQLEATRNDISNPTQPGEAGYTGNAGSPALYSNQAYYEFLNDTTIKRLNGKIWNWNGIKTYDASAINQNTQLYIARIYGVKIFTETPQEVRDIRVGYDGTTYLNAGSAVRGQIEDVIQQINATNTRIDNIDVGDNTPIYYGITASNPYDTTKVVIPISQELPLPNEFNYGDVLILQCNKDNEIASLVSLSINNINYELMDIGRNWSVGSCLILRYIPGPSPNRRIFQCLGKLLGMNELRETITSFPKTYYVITLSTANDSYKIVTNDDGSNFTNDINAGDMFILNALNGNTSDDIMFLSINSVTYTVLASDANVWDTNSYAILRYEGVNEHRPEMICLGVIYDNSKIENKINDSIENYNTLVEEKIEAIPKVYFATCSSQADEVTKTIYLEGVSADTIVWKNGDILIVKFYNTNTVTGQNIELEDPNAYFTIGVYNQNPTWTACSAVYFLYNTLGEFEIFDIGVPIQ